MLFYKLLLWIFHLFFSTRTSRKANWLFASHSLVKLIDLCVLFSSSNKRECFSSLVVNTKSSSTYLKCLVLGFLVTSLGIILYSVFYIRILAKAGTHRHSISLKKHYVNKTELDLFCGSFHKLNETFFFEYRFDIKMSLSK